MQCGEPSCEPDETSGPCVVRVVFICSLPIPWVPPWARPAKAEPEPATPPRASFPSDAVVMLPGVTVTASARRLASLDPGWIYLYDETRRIWHEYEVNSGLALLQEVKWGAWPKQDVRPSDGPANFYIDLNPSSTYSVAYTRHQWSRARLRSLESPRERAARMQALDPAELCDSPDSRSPEQITAEEDLSLTFISIVVAAEKKSWWGFVLDDVMGVLAGHAENYQETLAEMDRCVAALSGSDDRRRWFLAAVVANHILAPESFPDGELEYLDRATIESLLGASRREILRREIQKMKSRLIDDLTAEHLKQDPERLVATIWDYVFLPDEREANVGVSHYADLWRDFSALLLNITDPPYLLDLHLERDPEVLRKKDDSGRADPGLALMAELSDAEGSHPLRLFLFPAMAGAGTGVGAGAAQPTFAPDRLKMAMQLGHKTTEALFKFVACFEQLGVLEKLSGRRRLVVELLVVAGVNIETRRLTIGQFMDIHLTETSGRGFWLVSAQVLDDTGRASAIPPGPGALEMHSPTLRASRLRRIRVERRRLWLGEASGLYFDGVVMRAPSTGMRRWGLDSANLRRGLGGVLGMFQAWNVANAVTAVTKARPEFSAEFARSAVEIASASMEVLSTIKDMVELEMKRRALRAGTAVAELGKGVLARVLRVAASKSFERLAGVLGVGTAVYDIIQEWRQCDRDAVIGASATLVGTILGIIAVEASVPVLGWIAAAVTATGLGLYLWLNDGPVETWVKSGPFNREDPLHCINAAWAEQPAMAVENLLALMSGIEIGFREASLIVSFEYNDPQMLLEWPSPHDTVARIFVQMPPFMAGGNISGVVKWKQNELLSNPVVGEDNFEFAVADIPIDPERHMHRIDVPASGKLIANENFLVEVELRIDAFGDGTIWVPEREKDEVKTEKSGKAALTDEEGGVVTTKPLCGPDPG